MGFLSSKKTSPSAAAAAMLLVASSSHSSSRVLGFSLTGDSTCGSDSWCPAASTLEIGKINNINPIFSTYTKQNSDTTGTHAQNWRGWYYPNLVGGDDMSQIWCMAKDDRTKPAKDRLFMLLAGWDDNNQRTCEEANSGWTTVYSTIQMTAGRPIQSDKNARDSFGCSNQMWGRNSYNCGSAAPYFCNQGKDTFSCRVMYSATFFLNPTSGNVNNVQPAIKLVLPTDSNSDDEGVTLDTTPIMNKITSGTCMAGNEQDSGNFEDLVTDISDPDYIHASMTLYMPYSDSANNSLCNGQDYLMIINDESCNHYAFTSMNPGVVGGVTPESGSLNAYIAKRCQCLTFSGLKQGKETTGGSWNPFVYRSSGVALQDCPSTGTTGTWSDVQKESCKIQLPEVVPCGQVSNPDRPNKGCIPLGDINHKDNGHNPYKFNRYMIGQK